MTIKFKEWAKGAVHISREERDRMAEDAVRKLRRFPFTNYICYVTGDTLVLAQRINDGDIDLISVSDCKLRRRAEFPEKE
jgi:hypothetical protein